MPRVKARTDIAAPIALAERVFYDHARWPAFIDGFGALRSVEGPWPQAGARVVWDTRPGGRGRVVEQVTRHEQRVGQASHVEDERIEGEQRLGFTARDGGVTVVLELEYAIKQRNVLTPLVDLLFVRRAMADSLRRTLARLRLEVLAEQDPPL